MVGSPRANQVKYYTLNPRNNGKTWVKKGRLLSFAYNERSRVHDDLVVCGWHIMQWYLSSVEGQILQLLVAPVVL